MKTKFIRAPPEFCDFLKELKQEAGMSAMTKTSKCLSEVLREGYLRSAVIEKMRQRKSMGRRANIDSVIFFLVAFFVIVVTAIVVATTGNSVFGNTAFNSTLQTISGGAGNTTIQQWNQISSTGLDNMIVAIYFFGHIAIIALAAILPSSSIFFVINLILSMIFLLIAYLFKTIFQSVYTTLGVTGFSKFAWIIDNLFLLEFVFMILMIFVLYKSRNAGEVI